MENRKNFLDEIAMKLNIKIPSDWGNITVQQLYELGGSSLLTHYYNGSLFKCLQSVYKGIFIIFILILIKDTNWKREWFTKLPKSYWKSMENRRNFLDEIAKKLNIKTPSDWGKVTNQQLFEHGRSSLLGHYYNGSLFKCLQSVYKGIYSIFLFYNQKKI
jgi:hypothetical protein